MLWQVAAISLIGLYGVLALRFRGVLSVMAMGVATAGWRSISFARRATSAFSRVRGAAFAALDASGGADRYAANGLYTVALVLLVIAGWRELPRFALVLAVPVVVSGFALAAASLAHDARLETSSRRSSFRSSRSGLSWWDIG